MGELGIVIDSNVIFAALVRAQGLNRYIVTVLPELFPFFYPELLRKEIMKHIREITGKSGLSAKDVLRALNVMFEGMTPVSSKDISEHLETALEYVNDKDDAVFVACALWLKGHYDAVVILTWNLKDYRANELEKIGIYTTTPEDFMRALRLKYQRAEIQEKSRLRGNTMRIYKVLISVDHEDRNK